jgi:hypothetical protein
MRWCFDQPATPWFALSFEPTLMTSALILESTNCKPPRLPPRSTTVCSTSTGTTWIAHGYSKVLAALLSGWNPNGPIALACQLQLVQKLTGLCQDQATGGRVALRDTPLQVEGVPLRISSPANHVRKRYRF